MGSVARTIHVDTRTRDFRDQDALCTSHCVCVFLRGDLLLLNWLPQKAGIMAVRTSWNHKPARFPRSWLTIKGQISRSVIEPLGSWPSSRPAHEGGRRDVTAPVWLFCQLLE